MKQRLLNLLNSKRYKIAFYVFLIAITLTLSGFAYNILFDISNKQLVQNTDYVSDIKGSSTTENNVNPTPEQHPVAYPPAAEPWNGKDRVTMLLLGLDYRDWESGETASRSDSMILLTIDPISKQAGMLSIPRDLWANIPGFEPGKINTAYYLGDIYKLPGGGPQLAIKTVENTIGVPIDYYAQIDFSTFSRFIDLIGGVRIDLENSLVVDPLGNGPPVTLKPGLQTLPGDLALAYARNRYTEGGDFSRSQRQQEIILAIRDRFLEPNNFTRLLANADDIYAELSSGIHTNLPFEDALKLIVLAAQVDLENIKTGVIDERYVNFGESPDGLSILIPIPDLIRGLRNEIFGTGGTLSPLTEGSLAEKMTAEQANLYIENASNTPELEALSADYLSSLGFLVSAQVPTQEIYYTTVIIDHTGNPFTLKYLISIFGDQVQIFHRFNPSNQYDIELYLGSDWSSQNSIP